MGGMGGQYGFERGSESGGGKGLVGKVIEAIRRIMEEGKTIPSVYQQRYILKLLQCTSSPDFPLYIPGSPENRVF